MRVPKLTVDIRPLKIYKQKLDLERGLLGLGVWGDRKRVELSIQRIRGVGVHRF